MKKRIVLLVALSLSWPALSVAADAAPKGGAMEAAGTTVKSGKSNSSERAGAAAGGMEAAGTVKSSKSNSSERAAGAGVEAGTTVKSSKSNSQD